MVKVGDYVRDCLTRSAAGTVAASDEQPGLLGELAEIAANALREEDAALAAALTEGSHRFPDGYKRVSRGLAYWVYETSLVYTIFKAWAPKVVSRWEHPYGVDGHRADLAVFPSPGDGWVFEAKWWNANTKTATDPFLSDVSRLEKQDWLKTMKNPLAPNADDIAWRRFVIAFGFGDPADIDDDWPYADGVLTDHGQRFKLCFVSAFPSRLVKWWGRGEHKEIEGYVSMMLLEVTSLQE